MTLPFRSIIVAIVAYLGAGPIVRDSTVFERLDSGILARIRLYVYGVTFLFGLFFFISGEVLVGSGFASGHAAGYAFFLFVSVLSSRILGLRLAWIVVVISYILSMAVGYSDSTWFFIGPNFSVAKSAGLIFASGVCSILALTTQHRYSSTKV